MNIEDRIALFSEQLLCGGEIYTWQYDSELQLHSSNCPETLAPYLDTALDAFGGKELLRDYAREGTRPLLLSIPIGLVWCISAAHAAQTDTRVYVIGPVWNTGASISSGFASMEAISRERSIDAKWLHQMSEALRSLPVVMPSLMNQYALMLHCTVTGERVGMSELLYQQSHGETESGEARPQDRYRTWHMEQVMLRMVRDGDMGYTKAFNEASALSEGVPLTGTNTLRRAKTSVTVFTTLCTRAAIEGGLSPEEAYTLGDSYISRVEASTRVSDVAAFSYSMYAEFVQRVRSRRLKPTLSGHIRAVCDYVELHADEPFTNGELARRAGYSEQYLRRKFTEEMGISLPDYIRAIRMERAKDLLLHSELSIPEIAERLQFCSRGHFSEVFERTVGISPAKFRNQRI